MKKSPSDADFKDTLLCVTLVFSLLGLDSRKFPQLSLG